MRLPDLLRGTDADLEPPPSGWWHDLADDVLDRLYEEGREGGRELLAEADRQERKASVLLAWMLALISASGLFGDLELGTDALGAASWSAIAVTGIAVCTATYVFWPRRWDLGPNVASLAATAEQGERELRGQALDALVVGYCHNAGFIAKRAWPIDLQTALVPLQAIAVVAVQILATNSSATAPLA